MAPNKIFPILKCHDKIEQHGRSYLVLALQIVIVKFQIVAGHSELNAS